MLYIMGHIWRKLIVLQKKIMRIICQVKPRNHTDPLFEDLGIIKVVDINKYLTGKFMFRWCNGLMPQIFDNFFMYNSDVHKHNTRQQVLLNIPVVRTNLRKMSICFKGAIVWNSLRKLGLLSTLSEPVFSKKLKIIIMGNLL